MTREEIKALAARLAEAGYTAKDLSGMRTFARGGQTDSDETGEVEEPVYGGELAPAVVKPAPVEVTLTTYPVSRRYPISHSVLNSSAYPSNLGRQATPEDFNRHPVHISKYMKDPTYNLITNNCSDDTGRFLGDALHTNFIGGITTPVGLQRKVTAYLKRNNLPYEQSDPGVHTTIQIPWYDYRKAVDKYNDQMLLRAQEDGTALSAGWYRDQPRLQWHFDANGNATKGRADRGFIRRLEDGGATYNGGRMTKDNHTGTRYRKNANYFFGPADNYTSKAYRFVGLPEDLETWNQEYDANYSPLQVLPRISLELPKPVLQQPQTGIAK